MKKLFIYLIEFFRSYSCFEFGKKMGGFTFYFLEDLDSRVL